MGIEFGVTVLPDPPFDRFLELVKLTEAHGFDYEELVLNRDYTDRTLRAVTGATTFPQVYIDGKHVGGADELEAFLAKDEAA